MKKEFFLLLLLLFVQLNFSGGEVYSKIQVDDTWLYEVNGKLIDETALSKYEYIQGSESMTLIKINTTRQIDLGLKRSFEKDNFSFFIDLEPIDNYIYVTQSGGIPVFPSITFNGSVKVVFENETIFDLTIENLIIPIEVSANPASILATGENVVYYVYSWVFLSQEEQIVLDMNQQFVLSSDDLPSDNRFTVDFTKVTDHIAIVAQNPNTIEGPISASWSIGQHTASASLYRNMTTEFFYEEARTNLDLLDIGFSRQMTWKNGKHIPSTIKQSEPVEIYNPLKLDQLTEIVEYNLYEEPEETSSTEISNSTTSISTSDSIATSTDELVTPISAASLIPVIIYYIRRKNSF